MSPQDKEYESFVFYGSWKELLKGFDRETAKELLWDIVNAGVGEPIESENIMIQSIIQGAIIPNIKSAKKRYENAITNGKEGGRPRKEIDIDKVIELVNQGMTYQEIADIFGVSKNTIGNRVREHKNQKPKTETNKNLDIDIEKENYVDVELERNKTNITELFKF